MFVRWTTVRQMRDVAQIVDLPADPKPFLDAFCTEAMHAARHQPCILDYTCGHM